MAAYWSPVSGRRSPASSDPAADEPRPRGKRERLVAHAEARPQLLLELRTLPPVERHRVRARRPDAGLERTPEVLEVLVAGRDLGGPRLDIDGAGIGPQRR